MQIDIKLDTTKLNKRLKKLKYDMPRAKKMALGKAAEFAKAGIKQRTQEKSLDAFMKPLAPYSEAYIKFKGGKYTGKVDLTFTSQMWSSLTTKSDANQARLFFLGEPAKYAAFQHFGMRRGGKVSKPRPFFALSEKQQKVITKLFMNEFRKRFQL